MELGYDLFHNKVMNKYKPLYSNIFPHLNQSYGLGCYIELEAGIITHYHGKAPSEYLYSY